MKYGYFGEFVANTLDPEAFRNTIDFPLSRISAPITLHVSLADPTTPKLDIAELRSKVKSIVCQQTIHDPTFKHLDYVHNVNADKLVYKYILLFWKRYGENNVLGN